jgi:diguanylate cyclase (GGDEF)-like protein
MKARDKKIRILLIDDDADERLLLEEILLKANVQGTSFTMDIAASLEKGLQTTARGNVDMILLDLHLPDSKGIETFLKVNRSYPDIPIIILSVLYDDSLALEAVRRGAQDYMFKKELHSDVLLRTIRFGVERHALKQQLARANASLERLSLMDPVTELFNRRGLQEILSHELQRAHRKHSELLVLLIDLDDFKKINNALGHSAGDVVLKEVSQKLKSSLRATDYVGRVGGDEFMVFLPDTRFAEGMHIAEKIRMAIATTIVSMSSINNFKVTASLGLINAGMVSVPGSSDPLNDLISNIHLLLRQRPKSIKNHVVCDDQYTNHDTAVDISERLLGDEKFYAMMQPIFKLTDQTETACELLTRSLVKGFEMPDDFFRVALESNVLAKVDYQCLKACIQSAALLPRGAHCHVNLFPSTLINLPMHNFLELFSSVPERNFCIEISEQQIIGDPSYLREPVTRLRKAGVLIAIDDLGFGKSCLESLILLEPDVVKIDKRCVTGAAGNPSLVRSLKRLVKMAKSLESEVIAEGIETEQDLQLLKDLGVKFGQGYYLSKPKAVTLPIKKRNSTKKL